MQRADHSKAVLELGKRLIAQLELADDILAQWMAHDISARIAAIENAPEGVPISARDDCAKAILTLWEHRNKLPPHLQPFKDIEPVTRALAALDVEHGDDYRYSRRVLRDAALETDDKPMSKWLGLAFDLDYSARVLIQYALRSAGEVAASQASPWVKAALEAGAATEPDQQTFDFLLERLSTNEAISEDKMAELRRDGLRDKISRLESFAMLATAVAADLRSQVDSELGPSKENPATPPSINPS
ncbi:hypothetical protein WH299_15970 [Pseudomonas sp. MYb541]|uniref:hypothetical protein n=1 Tax=Pseudomonas sp. MYb541 TaxID=2745402 RepID=UPI00309FA2C5